MIFSKEIKKSDFVNFNWASFYLLEIVKQQISSVSSGFLFSNLKRNKSFPAFSIPVKSHRDS